jgi:hypothetical protein
MMGEALAQLNISLRQFGPIDPAKYSSALFELKIFEEFQFTRK